MEDDVELADDFVTKLDSLTSRLEPLTSARHYALRLWQSAFLDGWQCDVTSVLTLVAIGLVCGTGESVSALLCLSVLRSDLSDSRRAVRHRSHREMRAAGRVRPRRCGDSMAARSTECAASC
jgi:hypothetical protein